MLGEAVGGGGSEQTSIFNGRGAGEYEKLVFFGGSQFVSPLRPEPSRFLVFPLFLRKKRLTLSKSLSRASQPHSSDWVLVPRPAQKHDKTIG